MPKELFFKDKYYNGFQATSKSIDYITVFPKGLKLPEEKRDEYGNLQYKIVVDTVRTEDDGTSGERKEVSVVKDPQHPTNEQIRKVEERKLVEKIRQRYSLNDELSLLHRGDAEKKSTFEAYVAQCKTEVEKEISKSIVER